MKTFTRLTLGLAIASLTIVGCKSKEKENKNVQQPKGEVEISVACSGPDYFSDRKHFRANSVGESMDQATSKKKALANAKADLASFISTKIKAVIDNYVNSREMNNKEQVEERFEGLSREVIEQKMSGIKVICEKVFKTPENNYKTYIAIELGADDLVDAINERMTKNEELKIDYDYEKFKKTFDEEMQKMEKEKY